MKLFCAIFIIIFFWIYCYLLFLRYTSFAFILRSYIVIPCCVYGKKKTWFLVLCIEYLKKKYVEGGTFVFHASKNKKKKKHTIQFVKRRIIKISMNSNLLQAA